VIPNRSIPSASVIPELGYHDVDVAAEWLCRVFGFRERLRVGNHRIQLVLGNGAMVVTELESGADARLGMGSHSMLVRVDDVDQHHDRALRSGARVVRAATDHPFGERQYTVEDIGGHLWTFSQSIADVDPEAWGGELTEA
jgi:uncharacterized glyoxalase superfamily protein PhnB